MDTSKERAKAGDAADQRPRPEERARAKAYLDLWERHLVQAAVDGPVPLWMPPRA